MVSPSNTVPFSPEMIDALQVDELVGAAAWLALVLVIVGLLLNIERRPEGTTDQDEPPTTFLTGLRRRSSRSRFGIVIGLTGIALIPIAFASTAIVTHVFDLNSYNDELVATVERDYNVAVVSIGNEEGIDTPQPFYNLTVGDLSGTSDDTYDCRLDVDYNNERYVVECAVDGEVLDPEDLFN